MHTLHSFEGSVELYISDLAIVVFTGIKHTADWFLASFRENDTASGTCTSCHCTPRDTHVYFDSFGAMGERAD